MTDIIKDAKRLLDGATPGPWEWVGYSLESVDGRVLDFQCVTEFGMSGASRAVEVTPEDEALIAAAPENTQALAAETWEYQVQARSMKRPAWKPSTNDVLQKWYVAEDIEEAKSKALMYTPYFRGRENVEILVLRRRVSKPEVVNE